MKIAVASGKGGTGKTTVAVSLAAAVSKDRTVCFVDCDVEDPNAHIFLRPALDGNEYVYRDIPTIVTDKCTLCGACVDACRFGAMAKAKDKILVFPELCHGCGACFAACEVDGAIEEGKRSIGSIEWGKAGNIKFVRGIQKVGEASPTAVINAAKEKADRWCSDCRFEIIDSPPGTSCPMVTAIEGCDFCLLVCEPTPFGLYDLRLAVEVLNTRKIRYAVVVNKNDGEISELNKLKDELGFDIAGVIPFDEKYAGLYAGGDIPYLHDSGFALSIDRVRYFLEEKLG